MGSIIGGICDCGYHTKTMFLGGGMRNFSTYCSFPHYCEECHILFEANIFNEIITCPECKKNKVVAYDADRFCKKEGQHVVFFWNTIDQIGRQLELTNSEYLCPGCRKFSLIFKSGGSWD